LNRLNRNILHILAHLFFYNAILTFLSKNMPKANALKALF